MERRQFQRLIYAADASLSQGGRQWPTRIQDLSLQGALIAKPKAFDADPRQSLTLQLRLDQGETLICMDIMPVHVEESRIGCRVVQIDLESISELRRLIELNLGDSKLLQRELSQMIQ